MAACIQFNKVSKFYGSRMALGGLNLEVRSGEVLGLLGPNGAGKSTALYILAGLVRPTSGTVNVFGKNLLRSRLAIAARMGVLVERPAYFESLSVRKNVALHARLAQCSINIDRVLDRVGLLDQSAQRAGTLSLGMRQRLGLALAMLTEPELLVLDEPTNGLDVEAAQEVLELLRNLAVQAGVTIVLSSHLLTEVEFLCDRVALLNQGRLVACERMEKVLAYDEKAVDVLVDGAESAAKRLTEEKWVESVSFRPGRLQVRLRDESISHLNAYLLNAGYQIGGILPRQRTLQEFLLKAANTHDA
ncbi:MAG: ABC transporter ATP-binding protein [Candidatus Hydrogenedentes bacterium]|nr:ABC transporter ATP-binding protein [Candidatus Hydrogenedentota bacterium]